MGRREFVVSGVDFGVGARFGDYLMTYERPE
jgi:hypothetical protein